MGELTDKLKGNTHEAMGKAKQHSGNADTRAAGQTQEGKGKAEQLKGKVKGMLGDDI